MGVTLTRPALNNNEQTRARLLKAAGEVFVEQGFRKATVRDICGRAGANVAAVNYHFGDKKKLYEAVLVYAHQCARARFPAEADRGGRPPEERLREFIEAMVRRFLDNGRPAWHAQLLSREIAEPTEALDRVVQQSIRPQAAELEKIIRELSGARVTAGDVQHAMCSVVGQCIFYRNCQPVITRLMPGWKADESEIKRIAGHIARFSLAGIHVLGRD